MKTKILALLILTACTVQAEESSQVNQQAFITQQKQLKAVRQQLGSTRKEVTRLKKELKEQSTQNRRSLTRLSQQVEQQRSEQNVQWAKLNDQLNPHAATIEQLTIADKNRTVQLQQLKSELDTRDRQFTQLINSRSLWAALAAACMLIALVVTVWLLRRKTGDVKNSTALALENAINKLEQVEENRIGSEMKWVEGLRDIVERHQALVSANTAGSSTDHQLPIKVADEIFRMRKRLAALPEETKGLKPLTKSLERLESELVDLGYEIIDHTAMDFNESMAINSQIIASDLIEPGRSVITKVITPQINFQGTLNRMANVEVSVG